MYVHINVVIVLIGRADRERRHGISSTEDLNTDDIADNVS